MTKDELLESVKHISSYYDCYISTLATKQMTNLVPFMQTLATLMWVDQYPDDVHSSRIREQLQNLFDTGGFLFSK